MLLVASALAAPLATLAWRPGFGELQLLPPAGEHLAPEAGLRVEAQGSTRIAVEAPAGALHLPLPAAPFELEAHFSLCTDDGSRCRPVRVRGRAEARRGRLELVEAALATPAPSQGSAVRLYDFGAVWCPPCNLLAAEVLDDPADAALFATLPVERIDVDREASWALKSRHGVTGYPTLLAVDAEGREVARLIGYPGEAAFKAWLGALGAEPPLHALAAGQALGPAERARAARRLAAADQADAARPYLEGAAEGEDLAVARVLLDHDAASARWLFEHEVPFGDWVWSAIDAAPEHWPALVAWAPTQPEEAGGLWSMAADHAPEALRPGLRLAALAALRAQLDGDPAHDKALWADIADLEALTGDPAAARRTLDAAIAAFPEEFTFYHHAARLALDAGDPARAEAHARAGLARAFGDQVLRAAVRLSEVLAAQGRKAEAIAALDAALARIPAPPAGVTVRTSRYRAEAEARKKLLGG